MAFSSSFFALPKDEDLLTPTHSPEPVLNMWHYMQQDTDPSPQPLIQETISSETGWTLVLDQPTVVFVREVPLEACTMCTLFLLALIFGAFCCLPPIKRSSLSSSSSSPKEEEEDEGSGETKDDDPTSYPPPSYQPPQTMVKIHV